MNLPALPELPEIQGRLQRIFPEGLAGRRLIVRELAAKTVLAALFVGAVGDPDEANARLLRPSMVTWMSDEALAEGLADEAFRAAWHDAARRSRQAVAALLATRAQPHSPWYADNTREPIRDEVLRVWREQYGAVRGRAATPTTSPAPTMTLAADFAALFNPQLAEAALDEAIATWQESHLGREEQLRLLAQRRLDETAGQVRVTLPGRGDRLLPPGVSSALTRAVIEDLAPHLLRKPYVLAVCHGGDPTADADRLELEHAQLSLAGSLALPDLVLLDAANGTLWFVEIVVTGGEITERRRTDLLRWASERDLDPGRCRFLTVYRSRTEGVFRSTVAGLVWDSLVWFADEPAHVIRMEALPKAADRVDQPERHARRTPRWEGPPRRLSASPTGMGDPRLGTSDEMAIPTDLDRAAVRRLYGLTRVDVDRIFERLPVINIPGSRKVYVRRDDLEAYLEEHTYPPSERIRRVA